LTVRLYDDLVRRPQIPARTLLALAVAGVVAWLVTKASILSVVIAVLVGFAILRIGWGIVAGLATPAPEPPPPGELRKVRIMFRCSICGTEVRMTSANDEMPEPPRHCQEDMDLVAPID